METNVWPAGTHSFFFVILKAVNKRFYNGTYVSHCLTAMHFLFLLKLADLIPIENKLSDEKPLFINCMFDYFQPKY
jgi:hypothetical protein